MGTTHPRPASTLRNVTGGEQEFYAEIGRRIGRLRRRKGTSQQALSEVVGVARSTLANLERGGSGLSSYRLWLIARALDADVNELLPDSPERPERQPPVPVTVTLGIGRRKTTWVQLV